MPSTRKRTLREVESDVVSSTPETPKEPPKETSLLQRIRNTWQFANLFQWIYLFGKVVKIDESIDIDTLEAECLKHNSPVLAGIGLALLKSVSSHRGLTPDLFDEYTRRQYVARKPAQNPFGTDETPASFHDFDVFTKLAVLQQLTQWVMLHPERIRDKMDEQKLSDQTDWRIEPYGWDSEDREYYLLDDDRLYRRTDAPPPTPAWKPKKNSKKAKAAARAAKRRRVSRSAAADAEDIDDGPASDTEEPQSLQDDGFGGATWECIAVSLDDVRAFLATIRKTRDENEKILRDRLEEGLVPILEKQEESRKRKALAREKELLSLEKMAHAKRSSRLAGKVERQKQEEEDRIEQEKRRREEAAARKEEQLRLKREKERDNRLMSRENRLKEREVRRLKHEEELAQLSEDSKNVDSDSGRLSGRRLEAEIARNKRALEELDDEEEDWIFDCVCGVYGQVDDGTHSIACERCNVWQHSKCAGISEEEAEREDFHFICSVCKRKELNPPKHTVVKLKLKGPGDAPSSPPQATTATGSEQQRPVSRSAVVVEIPSKSLVKPDLSPSSSSTKASTQALRGPASQHSSPPAAPRSTIPVKPTSQTPILPPPSPFYNLDGSNPFSSPHPTLSPPQQSPNKSRAYSTINPSSPPAAAASSPGTHRILPPKGIFHISPSANGAASKKNTAAAGSSHTKVTLPTMPATSASPKKPTTQDANNKQAGMSPPPSSLSNSRRLSSSSATPSLLSTPQLKHRQPELASDIKTPTLPPTQNGLSPLKRSPPQAQQQSTGGARSSPAPPILPPVALSPTPTKQIMTPPVKPAEPMRPNSQDSNGAPGRL